MKRIAIDMTSTPKNKTGIGRYIKNLVESLEKIDSENHYYLLVQSDDLDGFNISANNFTFIPVNSKLLRKTYLRILWEQLVLPFRLKKLKIDLIHCPNFTAPYFSKVKKVIVLHDLTYFFLPEMHTPLKRELFKMYIRISAKKADALITISENSKYDIEKYFPEAVIKTTITPLGASNNFYLFDKSKPVDIHTKYNLPNNYILYVGTIEPRKNILNLIKAYEKLPIQTKLNYKLVLAGKTGWLYQDLLSYHQNSSDKDNIIFSGFIAEGDLPYLYKQASLFAYVSFYEGFGIPLIESMACDTSYITSNTSSMKEIAKDAAILVDPNNPDDIADAIITTLADKNIQEIHKNNFKKKLEYYNWEKCAKITLDVYKSIL